MSTASSEGRMRRLRHLLPYFRRYPWHLTVGLVAILGAVALGLVAPILIGQAVDMVQRDFSLEKLVRYALLLIGVTALQGVFSFTQRRILVAMSRHIEYDLRQDFFQHLESQPAGFFQDHYTGDLMARATNDLQAVRMLCGPAIMYSTNTLFTAIGALVLMARIHGPLTLLALATMPLVAAATRIFGQRIHRYFERVQEQFSNLSTRVQENLAGVRVVRAYAREEVERERFARLNREYVERNRSLIRWSAAFHPVLQLLVGVGFVAVLLYGGILVRRETITIGEFVSFNFFLAKLIWPMIAIGFVINLVQRGSASLGRIRKIMETAPRIADRPQLTRLEEVRGDVEFRDLTFAYGTGEPELQEVSLHVPAGGSVALVGRTGAGKTTLLSLLPRLIEPPAGRVFLDDVDVLDLPLAQLRGSIAMVPQETFLFSASVAENIAVGRPEASRDEIETAAAWAGLEEDLAGFPQGLETRVGERGITLSGGQKQRVTLARALLREAPVLLLDDCLSAVDTQTEERILGNLARVLPGRTVFLVSHRISTVQHAEQIVVLEDGRIAQIGTHQELLGLPGLYAELYRLQQLEEELAAV